MLDSSVLKNKKPESKAVACLVVWVYFWSASCCTFVKAYFPATPCTLQRCELLLCGLKKNKPQQLHLPHYKKSLA